MSALNRITLTGRLASAPKREETTNGTTVCKTRIAVDRAGNTTDDAGFVNVVSYGKSAEAILEYCSKGSLVAVDGQLRVSSWKTDDDSFRERVDVVGNLVFLQTKKADSSEAEPVAVGAESDEDSEF